MNDISNLPFCPRCGRKNGNALSRRMNITICDVCGQIEALEDFVGAKTSISNWYIYTITQTEEK